MQVPSAEQSGAQSGSAPGAHWALQVPSAEQSGPWVQVLQPQGSAVTLQVPVPQSASVVQDPTQVA